MDYQKKVWVTLWIVAIFLLTPAALVWYADPFHVFHRSFLTDVGLHENQRYQNAGLVNSWLTDASEGFDSLALGTSMSANITSASLASSFGWSRTLRLFIKGGGPSELHHTGAYALRRGKGHIKHLLWEINPWFYLDSYQDTVAQENFPDYLYNENSFDDVRLLFNLDSVLISTALLGGDRSRHRLTPETLGRHQKEEERHYVFNTWLQEWLDKLKPLVLTPWPLAAREAFSLPQLERHVFPLIDQLCNEDIVVILYIPPLSRLYYAEQGEEVYPVIYLPRKILERIQPCANMRLHAFDRMPFTADMNYYRDSMHYTSAQSEELLRLMAQGQQRLGLQSITAYEDGWIEDLNRREVHTTFSGTAASP